VIRFARSVRRFKINEIILVMMHVLVCRESGLDCDFVIKGETKEEFLKNGADHAIQNTVCALKISTRAIYRSIFYAIPLTRKLKFNQLILGAIRSFCAQSTINSLPRQATIG
jgi:hypothetical protein